MSEKNDKLIDNLLQSKFNWWSLFWKRLIGAVKVKSKDSSYQVYLDGIRKDLFEKNSEEDSKEDPAYREYLDRVKSYLEARGVRLLTEKEEVIVVAHLKVISATYCLKHSSKRNDADNCECQSIAQELAEYDKTRARNDADVHKGLGITQVLSIETAKKVSEIHEEFPNATPEAYDRRVAEVLAIQNYLKSEPVPRG